MTIVNRDSTDIPTAWLICVLYMLQIYYDFSGYSTIALGLSRVMGIELEENFNFPYLSTSISEFWRRWHISLGHFFRDYLYIPLGGSRRGKARTLWNLFLVMLISGIWHGAGLGYLAWGVMHGTCCVIEKASADKKWYKAIPKPVKWFFTMFIVMMGWEVFRLGAVGNVLAFGKTLIGIGAKPAVFSFSFYMSKKLIFFLVIAILGATVLGKVKETKLYAKIVEKTAVQAIGHLLLLGLLVVVMVYITNSTYSPFIYFQY